MTTPAEQVATALCYVQHHQSFNSGQQQPPPRHTELFRSNHGRPSEGAKRMGKTEYETLPFRTMIVLAAEVIRLRSVAADLQESLQRILQASNERMAAAGDLLDYQDTNRQSGDIARAAIAKAQA
jgi:hypothetical protein